MGFSSSIAFQTEDTNGSKDFFQLLQHSRLHCLRDGSFRSQPRDELFASRRRICQSPANELELAPSKYGYRARLSGVLGQILPARTACAAAVKFVKPYPSVWSPECACGVVRKRTWTV